MIQKTASHVICVTNNPDWGPGRDGFEYVDGGPWGVFKRARDLVHGGWRFLAHPLYGNFNPMRHPYRTLLLESPSGGDRSVDMESFSMLEAALESCRAGMAKNYGGESGEAARRDFAKLDCELMRDALNRYCLWAPVIS
ncbi:MAG: GrdX family protein [Synergistaceae bacterium]|jgi:hypothetical protein|nr:GrdX family protein [Synergistaceae bacterium]